MNTLKILSFVAVVANIAVCVYAIYRLRRGHNSTPSPHRQRIVPQVAPKPHGEEHAKISEQFEKNRQSRFRREPPPK